METIDTEREKYSDRQEPEREREWLEKEWCRKKCKINIKRKNYVQKYIKEIERDRKDTDWEPNELSVDSLLKDAVEETNRGSNQCD